MNYDIFINEQFWKTLNYNQSLSLGLILNEITSAQADPLENVQLNGLYNSLENINVRVVPRN